MAMLMRRLLEDAQDKFRRMVEEHSANLTSRIDPECSSSIGVTLPNPIYHPNENKLLDQPNVPPLNLQNDLSVAKTTTNCPEDKTETLCDSEAKCVQECTTDGFSNPTRPNSIESSKCKSLDLVEDPKKDVKITKSISEDQVYETADKAKMTAEDNSNVSPAKECSVQVQNLEKSESPKPGCSNQQDNGDSTTPNSSDGARDELSILLPSPSGYPKTHSVIKKLRLENERLQAEITRLRRLVVSGASSILAEKKTPTESSSESGKVYSLEMELVLAKEALLTLKSDRRRLKAEKFDLLNQMKQLYATLEDKEKELRDFIRNYEQRVRENETSLQQLSTEREERERERWSLLRHARDEAERSLSLAAQLNAKELQLQQAQEQLQEARRQLASNASVCLSDQESLPSLPRHSINGGALTPGSGGLLSGHHGLGFLPGDRGSCSADSGVRVSSDRESGATSVAGNLSDSTTDGTPTITVEGGNAEIDSISLVSSIPPPHMYQSVSAPKDCSPTLSPLNANAFARSVDNNVLSRSVEQLSSPLDPEPIIGRRGKISHSRPASGRGGTWGSISRVFARSRHRNKSNSLQENSDGGYEPYRSWSPLTEEGYAEKLRLLREASSVPMERWRAPTVLAWLEVALGMPQYGARCAENVKSGKIGPLHGQVLLELSDLELECGLGITHAMHRKKLRLAIEEHRHPALIRYPCIAQLGHTWVASEWLPDIGLSQYSESFTSNMVDARMLEHLSKKELEKYLGVTRKFHQASIVHGIHLLRIMKYDRQSLAVRRHQCENVDADPLVWTNQRFIRWARNIDLGEYADNLKDSGVHGGLVVLEPSFNSDTMATALGIPTSKNIIRRHLTAELELLILPARSTLEHYVRVRTKSRLTDGSLGRSFSRSYAGLTGLLTDKSESKTRRESLRESLNKAKGFFERNSEKHSPTSSSETSSVISHISSPLQVYRSSHSGGESPIYATPFSHQKLPSSILNRRSGSEEYEFSLTDQGTTKCSVSNHISVNESNKKLSSFMGGSLHRNKKHRRVRSIGNIDLIKTEAI